MHRTLAIIEREMRRFRRSPMLVIMAVLMPVVQLVQLLTVPAAVQPEPFREVNTFVTRTSSLALPVTVNTALLQR